MFDLLLLLEYRAKIARQGQRFCKRATLNKFQQSLYRFVAFALTESVKFVHYLHCTRIASNVHVVNLVPGRDLFGQLRDKLLVLFVRGEFFGLQRNKAVAFVNYAFGSHDFFVGGSKFGNFLLACSGICRNRCCKYCNHGKYAQRVQKVFHFSSVSGTDVFGVALISILFCKRLDQDFFWEIIKSL